LSALLSLRDLWVEYGDKVVLERVNLDIEAGSFVSIIGPSGAGKSSLLRVVLGQERPTRGSILLDGVPLAPNAGRIAAWCSSAIRCFRTCPPCAT
jgi:NitT/TauT family transport system ATP-binding protein